MKNYVLSNTRDSKKEYKKVINQTCSAIVKSINSEKSYAGPTPQELKEIVKQETILPENGLGYEKTFEKIKDKVASPFIFWLHGTFARS